MNPAQARYRHRRRLCHRPLEPLPLAWEHRRESRREGIGQMAQISENALRTQIAECTRMMVMAELLDYSGHISARLPDTDRILIPPRDASRAGVTADEILVVDLDGKVLEGKGPAPTETAI